MGNDSQAAQPIAETLFSVNLTKRQISKFWNKIRLIGASDDDCQEWTRAMSPLGYGVVRMEGRNFFVHRVAYFLKHGPFPNNLNICHRCDNPKCCNSNHLFLGTQADNIRDMFQKDRRPSTKGIRHGSAKLNDDLVRQIREKYATGEHTHRGLARTYGVSYSRIFSIVNRLTWKHLL